MKTANLAKAAFGANIMALVALPFTAYAEWSGGIEGGSILQGDVKGSNIELNLTNNERPFSQEINAEWLRADEGDDVYSAEYLPRYWLTDATYVFGVAGLTTFGSPNLDDYRRDLGAGIGIELINTETQNLFAEIGGVQQTSIREATPLLQEVDESVVSSGVTVGGYQIIAEVLKIQADTSYFTSDKQNAAEAEIGISYRVDKYRFW